MKSYLAAFLAASFTFAILVPAQASAQQVSSFERVPSLVKPGDTIVVTDTDGNSTHGKIAELSETSLSLITKGSTHEFTPSNVVEIKQKRRDSLRDGAKRGFWVGLGTGIGTIAVVCALGCNGREEPAAAVVGFALYGTAIGTVIDALNKSNQTIFRAPVKVGQSRVGVAPVLSRDRKGIAVTLSLRSSAK